MDHEGMIHAGRGKDKEEILSLFVWKSRVKSSCAESRGSSKLLASAERVARQTVGSCVACVRIEAFGSFLLRLAQ